MALKREKNCSSRMQDIEKWFGRWDATQLLHDTSLDFSMNEAFLKRQCVMTWKNVEAHASHILLHVLHLTTNHILHQTREEPHTLIHVRSHRVVCHLNHASMQLSSLSRGPRDKSR